MYNQYKYWKYCMLYSEGYILYLQNFKVFADHSSKILISKVDKFYTGFTMIMQKNSRFVLRKKL